MYIHQVISSILKIGETLKNDSRFNEISPGELDKHSEDSISNLMRCVSYHFEDIEQIQEMTNKAGELFTGEYGIDTRLPYPSCWFDFECHGIPGIAMAGVAAYELESTSIFVEAYIKKTGQEVWVPSGINTYIGIGTKLDHVLTMDRSKNLTGLEDVRVEMISENLWLTGGIYKNSAGYAGFDEQYQEDKQEVIYFLRCFNACLLLLSCKNIQTETVPAPAKLNKKRARSGKPLIQEHRVLKLVLPKRKGQKPRAGTENIEEGGGWTQKPSFCSGHFKNYTADAPLFGRLTGRYWWEPHVRGAETTTKNEYIIIPRRKK